MCTKLVKKMLVKTEVLFTKVSKFLLKMKIYACSKLFVQ